MSVIVKGMKMPTRCVDCPFMVSRENDDCIVQSDEANAKAETWADVIANCPLVELPEKHGRLVDADALHRLFEEQWHYLQVLDWDENPTAESKQTGINWCINTMHDDAPTVIEAEGDE